MARILELYSGKVQNNIEEISPPSNKAYYSNWYDCSGNSNHGVLTAGLYYFDSRNGWLGSYDPNDYFNLYFGLNASGITVPTLYNTAFPQSEGTLFTEINFTEFTTVNNCNLLGINVVNNAIIARLVNYNAEYGISVGAVGNDGLYKGLIQPSDYTANRIVLNTINKIAIKYKTGVGGYIALFINGVKIAQVSITDSSFVPSAQSFRIGNGASLKKLYNCMLDNTALSDAEIIAIQAIEYKTLPYSLPTLNKHYVAWGDSITWTAASGKNYTNLLNNYVKNTYGKIRYFNKGIGGITSAGLVSNLNSLNYTDGDIVTIGVGMNDCVNQAVSVANYTINLGLAIDYIRSKNPSAQIILCTPSGTSDANRTPYIANYRTAMETVATAKNCHLCKFHEVVTDANIGSYSSDGIHPNEAGHALLFNLLKPIIDEFLG